MGKQSSRLYYQGKDHKEIYYQGHYHDAMYIGSTLVWEKVKGEAVSYVIAIVYADGVYYAIATNIFRSSATLYEGKSLYNMSNRGVIFTSSFSLRDITCQASINDGELKVFICITSGSYSSFAISEWTMIHIPLVDGSADIDGIFTGFGDETYFYSNILAEKFSYSSRGRVVFTESEYFYMRYTYTTADNIRWQLSGTTGLDGDSEYENTWGKWGANCTYYTAVSERGDKLMTTSQGVSAVDSQYYVCIGEYDSENNTVNLHPINLEAVVKHCFDYCEAYIYDWFAEHSAFELVEFSTSATKVEECLNGVPADGALFPVGNNDAYARIEVACNASVTYRSPNSSTSTISRNFVKVTFYYNVRLSLDDYSIESFDCYEDSSVLTWWILSQVMDDTYRVQCLYCVDLNHYVSYGLIGADYTKDTYILLECDEDVDFLDIHDILEYGITSIVRTETMIIVDLAYGYYWHILINTQENTAKLRKKTLVYA